MKPNYIVIPLLVLAVSVTGSLFTSQGMMGWYSSISLPSWTPGGEIIGLAWTIIFILSAISLLLFWNRVDHNTHRFQVILSAFILNGILNITWSYLFFYKHLVGWAAVDALLLGVSVLIIIIELWSESKTAALLLAPYFLWVSFATYLNYSIYLLN